MPLLHIHLEGEGSLEKLGQQSRGELVHLQNEVHITALPVGTVGGKPSVGFGFLLPDGRMVIAETTLALFLMAADAFKARYGDPRR